MTSPRPAPPEPQTQSEKFNVPGVLRMLKSEAAAAYTGERTKIELVARLIRQQHDEIDRLRAALERIAANNDFLFLAEMAECAREALAVSRPETTHADQS